jgi:hypothetical protein
MNEHPSQILSEAIKEHGPVSIFALFSGGNDSLASTHCPNCGDCFCDEYESAEVYEPEEDGEGEHFIGTEEMRKALGKSNGGAA